MAEKNPKKMTISEMQKEIGTIESARRKNARRMSPKEIADSFNRVSQLKSEIARRK